MCRSAERPGTAVNRPAPRVDADPRREERPELDGQVPQEEELGTDLGRGDRRPETLEVGLSEGLLDAEHQPGHYADVAHHPVGDPVRSALTGAAAHPRW